MAAQERSQVRQRWLVSHKGHLDFLQSQGRLTKNLQKQFEEKQKRWGEPIPCLRLTTTRV